MPDRAPRFVPLTWAGIDIAAAAALLFFWRPETGTLWWFVRGLPVIVLLAMGGQSLWTGLFASDEVVRRRVEGDFTDNSN